MADLRWPRFVVAAHVHRFEPMSLGQQRAEEELGKFGIDPELFGPFSPAGEHLADSGRLEDLGLRLTLQGGNVLAQTEPPGQRAQEIMIALVDLDSEL